MPVSVSTRRPKISKKTEPKNPDKSLKDSRTCCNNICWIFSSSVLYLVPFTILLIFLVYLWSASTSTFIANDVVHGCISSRKLNDLSCLTAGYHPSLRVPDNNFTKPFSGDVIRSKEERSGVLDQDSKPKKEINPDLLADLDTETGEERYRYIEPEDENEESALKVLDEYLQIQRSWLSVGTNRENLGSCEGKGVYVYDLPSKFNKDLLGECSKFNEDIWPNFCSFLKNDGFGESIENLGEGWFRTHQYSLEPIFHSRVLKHPCRVYVESQAKLFYVPFYGGMDVLRWHFKNVTKDVKDVLTMELVKWLGSKKSWRKNSGKDHVFILGKICWDFRRPANFSWGSRLLDMQEMKNPTKLLIERHPWELNDVAIPHPTFFHPKTDDDISSWQNKIIVKPRRSLISFAGGARPGNPDSIRSILIDQCTSSPDQCRFLNCFNGGCDKPEPVMELFQDSEFCLQPPGDSATRKSVFDSLVSGCIPVLFDPYTAYYQYAWHLPEDHRRYSVYINKEDLKAKKVNVIEKLMSKTLREREEMRNYIVHELLPGLLYGDPNAKFERFRDAFDITMDSLLHKIFKIL